MKKRILISAVTIVAVCIVFVCMFMTDKAEFKSPDGKITATFTEFDKTLTFSGEGELSGSYGWIEKDPDYEKKTAKAVNMESIKRIVFEPGITSIANWDLSFDVHHCLELEKIVFKGDIDKIGHFAFAGHPNPLKVIFKGNCKSIGDFAFLGVSYSIGPIPETVVKGLPKKCDTGKMAFECATSRAYYDMLYTLMAE